MINKKEQKIALEFYPAALEIQERTPPVWHRITIWVIVALILFTILWATFSKVDVVSIANGNIIAIGKNKVVQSLTGGEISAIYVKEGDQILKDQELVTIDPVLNETDLNKIKQQENNLITDIRRIKKILQTIKNPESINSEINQLKDDLLINQLKEYGELLSQAADRPDYNLIQTMLLRSMNQALYSPDNVGHFGLAYDAYVHFTSPIRRYPDLLVHRAIKEVLNNKESYLSLEELGKIGQHCSTTERRADDATREVTKEFKCQYMLQHLGEIFSGVISGVTRFGFFVELSDLYVDGLVHITSMHEDYYLFNEISNELIGEHSGKNFAMGMKVTVQLARVDVKLRRIDLELVTSRKMVERSKRRKRKQADKKAGKNIRNKKVKK